MGPRSIGRVVRSAVLYLLLVVPPFAGLLVILHLGRQLRPARSINGDWHVDGAPCATGILHVAQSGPRAEARVDPDTSLTLVLDGEVLTGEGHGGACRDIAIEARLTRDAIVGVIRRRGCADCAPLPFQARR